MNRKVVQWMVAVVLSASFAVAQDVVHVVDGVVKKVDATAKTVTVATADGTERVFKYTEKTTVHGTQAMGKAVKVGAVDTYFKGKEGTEVMVRYMGKGADATAVGFHDLGKGTVKVAKGTVTKFDKGTRTVTVKTEDGTVQTYKLSKDAMQDSEKGVVHSAQFTAKEGDKITVHYTEDAADKVAHFFD
jgi:ribosomal protein S17